MPWWRRTEGDSNAQDERRLFQSPEWQELVLVAVFVAGMLAMMASWFLGTRRLFAIADSNYLFFFLFVFDLFLIGRLINLKFRKGQQTAAGEWVASLSLLGLLVGEVVGLLPFLWHRLVGTMPWISHVPWDLVLALWFLADGFRRYGHRRKSH
jgi:hypothetical protein